MSTPAIVVPSDYRELEPYPCLRELLHRQVDMQFADLATLLQLPLPNTALDAGANLTTTVLLCNVVSGASALFFEASLDSVRGKLTGTNRLGAGQRFRQVLDFFPWDSRGIPARDAGDVLYKYARNPLAHSLGVGKAPGQFPGIRGRNVLLSKRPLLPAAVAEVMRAEPERPAWSGSPIIVSEGDGYVISVEGLAWGVCRMLRALFADPAQVTAAEATARHLLSGSAA